MLIPVGLFGGPRRQGYRLTRIVFTNATRILSGLGGLLWAGSVIAAGAGTLGGTAMPSAPASLLLPSTAGRLIDLSKRDAARTVVYCYLMTGVPERIAGGWT